MSSLFTEAHRSHVSYGNHLFVKGYLETRARQRRMERIQTRTERHRARTERSHMSRPANGNPQQDLKDQLQARINAAFNGDGASYYNRAFIAKNIRLFERPLDGTAQVTIVEF